MVRNDRSIRDIVAIAGIEGAPPRLRSGDVVRVEVLDASRPGRARIRLAGAVMFASDARLVSPGDTFLARVTVSNGSILLNPIPGDSADAAGNDGILARLGLPETPVTAYLASFFRSINARLDPALLRSISAIAARFPGKEKRAAEAAAILAERGIEPDEETVARLISCLEGEDADGVDGAPFPDGYEGGSGGSGGSGDRDPARDRARAEDSAEKGSREERNDEPGGEGSAGADSPRLRRFLSFVNAKKGSEFHWVVVPFSLALSDRPCRGSVRFLLDLSSSAVLQTRVTCLDGRREWDFLLAGGECSFDADPPLVSGAEDLAATELARSLAGAGILSVARRARLDRGEDLPRVDVRA